MELAHAVDGPTLEETHLWDDLEDEGGVMLSSALLVARTFKWRPRGINRIAVIEAALPLDQQISDALRAEAEVLKNLQHDHIVRVYGIAELKPESTDASTPARFGLITELFEGPLSESGEPLSRRLTFIKQVRTVMDTRLLRFLCMTDSAMLTLFR